MGDAGVGAYLSLSLYVGEYGGEGVVGVCV
jgi:hypothetical protein